jgi:hypothetical protein
VLRRILLIAVVVTYAALGVYDLCTGRVRTGAAGVLLAVVNAILFS